MSFKLDDSYVDVAERIREFYEKNPEGAIRRVESRFVTDPDGHLLGYFYRAAVYRNINDPVPAGEGEAFEQIPGKTPYTKDSEVMNAETSAWGRAIVAAGIPSKKIASADEVRARQTNGSEGAEGQTASPQGAVAAVGNGADDAPSGNAGDIEVTFGKHKGKRLRAVLDVDRNYVEWLAGTFEAKTADAAAVKAAAQVVLAGGGDFAPADPYDSEIPFERTI